MKILKTILSIIGWLLFSWILIHLLALLGVFLAIAYPIWWLFAPKLTMCFICRTKKDGQKCSFCKQVVIKQEGYHPKSLPSAIYNGFLILLFSLVSLALVFGESKILVGLGFSRTPKTVSFIIPTKNQYRLGEIFSMQIEIVGIKVPINAVQADLGFNAEKIEVIDISTDSSFANIFIQKEINNEAGFVRLTGGLANPGFSESRGVFGTVLFRGKKPGLVKVDYLENSMVLANNKQGTNVLKDLASISYLILPERISKEEDRLQTQLIINPLVLGESTNKTQMKFYEEDNILGAYSHHQESQKVSESNNIFSFLLEKLDEFDDFVFNTWYIIIDTIF